MAIVKNAVAEPSPLAPPNPNELSPDLSNRRADFNAEICLIYLGNV